MNFASFLPGNNQVFALLLLVWSVFWKGVALWRSAINGQRNWFIVILIVSSLGILEIVYLFRFAKKRLTLDEMSGWFRRK